MSDFFEIYINTLDDGVLHFFQTVLIHKVLKATEPDHCNGFPTPTNAEALLGTDVHGSEAKRYWPNSCASVIGMMFYMASNTRRVIYFSVHRFAWLTNNTKA